MKKSVITILVIALLLVGAFYLFSETDVSEEDNTETVSSLLSGPNAIYAPDQPTGNSVIVMQAVMEQEGFIVVHEDEEGSPGMILGSSDLFDAGASEDITVSLSRNTEEGETLYAMLHNDNGDGEFNADEDEPVRGDNGNAIYMEFMISDDAEIPTNVSL